MVVGWLVDVVGCFVGWLLVGGLMLLVVLLDGCWLAG